MSIKHERPTSYRVHPVFGVSYFYLISRICGRPVSIAVERASECERWAFFFLGPTERNNNSKKKDGAFTVFGAQGHLLEAVVFVVVDDEGAGVVEVGGIDLVVKVAATAGHERDPRPVGRHFVVHLRLTAKVRRVVGVAHVHQLTGGRTDLARAVLGDLAGLAVVVRQRRVQVRHVQHGRRVLVAFEGPLFRQGAAGRRRHQQRAQEQRDRRRHRPHGVGPQASGES